MTTVSNAVAQRATAGSAVIEQYRNIFAEVLPSHVKPETWVRVAQGALRKDPALAQAAAGNPQSLVSALLDAARRGLEPGTEQYYLVAFGGEVTGIPGYQGEIELIYRAGAVSSVIAEVVHAGDKFDYQPGMERPIHEIDWDAEDRGELRLVYAYALMKDGSTSRVVVMNKATVMRHKAVARGSDSASSPWRKWPESMWLKTAVHELQKWVPTSAEYLRDQARAAGEMIRHANRPTSPAPVGPQPPRQAERPQEPVRADVVEGTVVDEPQADTADSAVEMMTTGQRNRMFGLWKKLGYDGDANREQRLAITARILGVSEVSSTSDLTYDEAERVIAALKDRKAQQAAPGGEQS